MQQTLFAMERGASASGEGQSKTSPVMLSALGPWQQGKRGEVLGMIEHGIDRDASLLYVYAGLKGLWMAEKTLGEALSYLRVAADMNADDPNIRPVLEEARQNLVTFNSILLDAVTTLGIQALDSASTQRRPDAAV